MKTLPEELRKKIQSIANGKNISILTFIAPQDGIKTSPISFASAAIQEKEMYRLEEMVKSLLISNKTSKKLHLIIQTPGGELHTSYKIASFLRNKFADIEVFVPYQAASGGTLICCAANKIYIGELGNITPIDPQIRYKNTWVSAYAFERATDTLKNLFGEHSPGEVPTPWQQMADKLDPIIYDEMSTLVFTTLIYAKTLLEKSGYDNKKAFNIALSITRPENYSHSFVLSTDQARDIGFNIGSDDDTMRIYGELVSFRLKEKSADHSIEEFHPEETS